MGIHTLLVSKQLAKDKLEFDGSHDFVWTEGEPHITAMAVGKGFFDQYSVFCVFGSVVGCVVVPLITQSVESVIFSAIVISLTATHLTKRATNHSDSSTKGNSALIERRNSRKSKDKDKESGVLNNPRKRKSIPQAQVNGDFPQCRKKREDDQRKFELAKQLEWERKQVEKREKKLKKKEERIRRKEQEREEKEKEELKLKQLREERLRAKQLENQKTHQEKGSSRTTPRTLRKQDHQHKPVVKPLGSTNGPSVHVPLGDLFTRQRSQSEGSDSTPPCPPPSVWKVPEYVEPKWNPGKLTEKIEKKGKEETKLNNDVICERSKVTAPFNQLYNP